MTLRIIIRENNYHDSMVLMQISSKILEMEGVKRVAIMMATENNKQFIVLAGFNDQMIDSASVSDLVIALETVDDKSMSDALANIDRLLKERGQRKKRGTRFVSLEGALERFEEASLAVISIPGQFAGREARKALQKGLHVFLFSDNVPIEEEVELKHLAMEKGLLLMGPDCGTAVINGVGIGFANAVKKGPIGVIGASGTGIQELCSILHQAGGLGISHAIGTGGRDLSDRVGGITTLSAIDFLVQDTATELILLVSKPPSPKVSLSVAQKIASTGKPAVLCFLGLETELLSGMKMDGIIFTENLEEAALTAIQSHAIKPGLKYGFSDEEINMIANKEKNSLLSKQQYIRGVFSGGSFCYESMLYLRKHLKGLHANSPITGIERLKDSFSSVEHTFIDLGEDEFTQGKVHPMIDPKSVAERILKEAKDDSVAVILFDVILGYGAHPDPVSVFLPILRQIRGEYSTDKRNIILVTHLCGTDLDLQNKKEQEEKLKSVGVHVMATNLQATKLASEIVRR